MLGSQSRIRHDDVRKQQQLLKQVKLIAQGNKDALTILEIVEKIILESKLSNDSYRFILYVLESIVLEKPENIIYDEQKMLTDKDRKALDWIHKYMEHSSGEDTGQ
jgi:hypothetical protein